MVTVLRERQIIIGDSVGKKLKMFFDTIHISSKRIKIYLETHTQLRKVIFFPTGV
jgi:hypothetical protein